jgi:hypothetical protein
MQPDLTAGDSLNYETDIPLYPPSQGWTAVLRLVPAQVGGAAVKIPATTSPTGDRFLWQVSPAVTSLWVAGSYAWAIWVEKAGERYTQQRGRLLVTADPDTLAVGTDTRSQAQRSLDAINAMLENRASDAQLRYKINGRELERYPLQDVLRLKAHFEAAVATENRAAGLADSRGGLRRILIRCP